MSENNTNITDAEIPVSLPAENADTETETETRAQENETQEQKTENIVDNTLTTNNENIQNEDDSVNKTDATSEVIDVTTSNDVLKNAADIDAETDNRQDSPVLLIDDKSYTNEENKETSIKTNDSAVESVENQREVKNDITDSCNDKSTISEEMAVDINEGVKGLSLIQNEESEKLAKETVGEESNLMELSASNIIEIDDESDDEMKADESIKPTEATNIEQDKNINIADNKNVASSTSTIEVDTQDESKKIVVQNKTEISNTEINENTTINQDFNAQNVEPMIIEDNVQAEHITENVKTDENVAENKTNPVKNILADYLLKKASNKPDTYDEQLSCAEFEKDEIFYNKLCVNYDCPKSDKQYVLAPMFILSFYKISKKKHQKEFVCIECYDKALEAYEVYSTALSAKQPLYMKDSIGGRQEFVEIIDSDEETSDVEADKNEEINVLPKNIVDLVENELQSSIEKTLHDVDIQNQLTWCKSILYARINILKRKPNLLMLNYAHYRKKQIQ